MLISLSKTVNSMAGPCSPKHGPAHFTVLNDSFILNVDVKQTFKNSQFYGWDVLTNTPYHGPALLTMLNNLFILTVDVKQLFKNFQFYGWAVLPQTRPSSFYGVEYSFHIDC